MHDLRRRGPTCRKPATDSGAHGQGSSTSLRCARLAGRFGGACARAVGPRQADFTRCCPDHGKRHAIAGRSTGGVDASTAGLCAQVSQSTAPRPVGGLCPTLQHGSAALSSTRPPLVRVGALAPISLSCDRLGLSLPVPLYGDSTPRPLRCRRTVCAIEHRSKTKNERQSSWRAIPSVKRVGASNRSVPC
jgi:hypothetical protein